MGCSSLPLPLISGSDATHMVFQTSRPVQKYSSVKDNVLAKIGQSRFCCLLGPIIGVWLTFHHGSSQWKRVKGATFELQRIFENGQGHTARFGHRCKYLSSNYAHAKSVIITCWWVLYNCRNSPLRQKYRCFDRKSPSGNSCCWTYPLYKILRVKIAWSFSV